jgi:serine/threonine-protein kinase HipA
MKCLICYDDVREHGEIHSKCSKKLFGRDVAPEIGFGSDQVLALAKNIVRTHVTIPGVQKKLSAHIKKLPNEGARMTLVGLWGDYILKPSSSDYPLLAVVEDCTMRVAAALGIETMKHGLIRLKSGELAYIRKRHDRVDSKPIYHMEDGCQLTSTLTEYKYRCSTEKLGKSLGSIVSHTLLDLIKFFEMVIVSFLTGNADMHLKNFSVYYRDAHYFGLAPAYDMVSTRLLISEKDDSEELALTLNGKKRTLKLDDFLIAAKNLGLSENQASNAMARISKKIPKAIEVIEKSFLPTSKANEFIELLSVRSQRLRMT